MSDAAARRAKLLLLAVAATLGAGAAIADMNGGRSSPAARYEVERANCLLGVSSQDRDDCLREAGAAYAQARREGLGDDTPARFAANRLRRCEPLPDAQRHDCVARMQGQGTTSGSVAEGGIYRELVTTIENLGTPDNVEPDRGEP